MTAVVDRLWGPCFQRWDETVFDGNTMLHLTCAAVLTDKVRAFLEDGGSKDILSQPTAGTVRANYVQTKVGVVEGGPPGSRVRRSDFYVGVFKTHWDTFGRSVECWHYVANTL